MRRKLMVAALSLLGVAILLVLFALWYIRSGRLDNLLKNEIIAAAEEVGLRVEIEQVRLDIRGYRVILNGVDLYAERTGKQLASIAEVVTDFSVIDYLSREIEITRVQISQPELSIEIDAEGRTSLDTLHAPPERPEKKEAIKFTDAYVEILGGKFNLTDRKRNIRADVPDFYAKFNHTPDQPLEDPDWHALELGFNRPASLHYEDRAVNDVIATIRAELGETSAKLNEITISSSLANVHATGQIPAYKPLKYDLAARSDVALREIARVFVPDMSMEGHAVFDGKVEGAGAEYKVLGGLTATSIVAEGYRISGLEIETDVTGSGADYTARSDVTTSSVSGDGLEANTIKLGAVRVTGTNDDFDVTGALTIAAVKSGKITVSGFRGQLEADPDRVNLTGISASVLGGSLSGSASVAHSGGTSRLSLQFRSLDLNQAATLVAASEVRVQGTANGSADLSFPGLTYQSSTGKIEATFDARVSPPGAESESSPAAGHVRLIATGRGLHVEAANVRSASSELTASGTVGWDGTAALDVRLTSQELSEVQRAVESFGVIPADVRDQVQIEVVGKGEFNGRVRGKLDSPVVTGHLSLDTINSGDELLGRFDGDIAYQPSLVRVENASLARPDGSRIDFTLTAPLEGENNIALNATVQNFDLASLVRVADPRFNEFVSRGSVTGKIDLTGLPGPRTVDGTADVVLSAAEFTVPAEEEGREPTRFSVPEFKGQVTFADSVLSVSDLTMQVGETLIAGQGRFNLDTYAYSINAEGKNLDLASLAEAAETVRLGGRADLTITGEGLWKDWSDINVNALLQGTDVTIEGRDFGDARLQATTENGLLKLIATGNVLNEERSLEATIDLRERKTLPVNANLEFADADLAQYLGLLAPELSGISGRATGSIRLSGPLLDPNQTFSADGITAVATFSKLEFGGVIADGQSYTVSNQGDVVIRASLNEVSIDQVTFIGESTSLTLGGSIARNDPSRSGITVDGEINLGFVSSFSETVFTTGVAKLQASITGSLEDPRLLGSAELKDIGVRVVDVPLRIARGNGIIRFTSDQALLENFMAATPGGGNLVITGGAALTGLVPDRWRFNIEADQVRVTYPQDTNTVFDAELVFQGTPSFLVLSGDAQVRRASYTREITLEELARTGGPFGPEFLEAGPGGEGPGGLDVRMDIRVEADNTIQVRNNIVDAVGSAFLHIGGPLSEPIISGRVQFTRGALEFRQGRHEITRGLVTLPGRRGAEPVVDFQSEADIGGYSVIIGFNGPLNRLRTTLRSDPELPEPDIISLVLTGSLSGSSTAEATSTRTGLGLAQSLLAAGLSEQLQRGTQRLFGLSRFSIDPLIVGRGNDPTARITVGQRITKDFTITYSQNLSGSSELDRIVLVEYRISNRFSIVGFRNDRSELGFDVRFRRRF